MSQTKTQNIFLSILRGKSVSPRIINQANKIYTNARKSSKKILNNANSTQQSNHIILALFFIGMIGIIITITLNVSGFCNPSNLNSYVPTIIILIILYICCKW